MGTAPGVCVCVCVCSCVCKQSFVKHFSKHKHSFCQVVPRQAYRKHKPVVCGGWDAALQLLWDRETPTCQNKVYPSFPWSPAHRATLTDLQIPEILYFLFDWWMDDRQSLWRFLNVFFSSSRREPVWCVKFCPLSERTWQMLRLQLRGEVFSVALIKHCLFASLFGIL